MHRKTPAIVDVDVEGRVIGHVRLGWRMWRGRRAGGFSKALGLFTNLRGKRVDGGRSRVVVCLKVVD